VSTGDKLRQQATVVQERIDGLQRSLDLLQRELQETRWKIMELSLSSNSDLLKQLVDRGSKVEASLHTAEADALLMGRLIDDYFLVIS
jgi:uncharacterized coiled-coil DUF342 family protein